MSDNKPSVLFLDFDGVLNSEQWFRKSSNSAENVECGLERSIDPDAVSNLNHIIEETGCQVVISSTWRRGNTIPTLLRLLVARGLDKKHWDNFIGATPVLDSRLESGLWTAPARGHEIQAWLDDLGDWQKTFARIVILDDDGDMAHLMPHLIQTSGATGLDRQKTEAVIAKLKGLA